MCEQEQADAKYWHDTRELEGRVQEQEGRAWMLVQRAEAAEERACLVEAQLNEAARLRHVAQDQLANMTATLSVCIPAAAQRVRVPDPSTMAVLPAPPRAACCLPLRDRTPHSTRWC